MYKEEYYNYSGKEGKRIKEDLKNWGFHHLTISRLPADFFRMSKSQLEKLFEHASDAFISRMYDVPIHQIQSRRSDFDIKQFKNTLNRMEREDETVQIFKEILRIVSNEYNNGNIPHTNSTPLNSEKELIYMKATGIVRRIDDLGRVVIPKEIRRTLRIREGDPLEIFTNKDGEVIFKKYSPISELSSFSAEYAAALGTVTGFACVITDRDNVIAFAGSGKREAMDKPLSVRCEEIISGRRPFLADSEHAPFPLLRDQEQLKVSASWPILAGGDIVGMIGLLDTSEKRVTETEEKLLYAAALFLGKQMEG